MAIDNQMNAASSLVPAPSSRGGGGRRRRRASSAAGETVVTPSNTTVDSSGTGRSCRRLRSTDQNQSSAEEVMGLQELVRQILIKLPAKIAFRFTLVSRGWNGILGHPSFIKDWKPPVNPSAIYIERKSLDPRIKNHTCISLVGGGGERAKRTTGSWDFVLAGPWRCWSINHSSNGLLLCSADFFQRFYLYNPTLQRGIQFPKPPEEFYVISMNLAFEAADEFKIISVCTSPGKGGESDKYHILVLEANQTAMFWRNTGIIFPALQPLDSVLYSNGVFLNGSIYWPTYYSKGLMYYKVKEEELVWLPEVPQPNGSSLAFFGECRGRLCMVKHYGMRGTAFKVIELKSDHSMWYTTHHIDLSLRVRTPLVVYPITVLGLLPGEEGDASYIILHLPGEVVSYNFKDQTLNKLCDLGMRPREGIALRLQPWLYVHTYKETFLPPERLIAP